MKNTLIVLLIVLVAVCCAKPNGYFLRREFRQQDARRQDNERRTYGNACFLCMISFLAVFFSLWLVGFLYIAIINWLLSLMLNLLPF